jgi:hypothetical protein
MFILFAMSLSFIAPKPGHIETYLKYFISADYILLSCLCHNTSFMSVGYSNICVYFIKYNSFPFLLSVLNFSSQLIGNLLCCSYYRHIHME